TFPDIAKYFHNSQDKQHQIKILEMQIELQRQGSTQRLEEITVQGNQQADIAESEAIYKTYTTGIDWVDALNGTVRPIIAYSFFILYATVKIVSLYVLPTDTSTSVSLIYTTLWTDEDAAIFAGIISFYFGQRAMNKVRKP
ncbi:MAG: hypothetical protein K0R98_858, partial [Rickettsiaceae bacterium]|nr:hypothetical protein [Rickettsiaceae bacterium]